MSTSRCSCRTIVARSPSIEKQTLKSLNHRSKDAQSAHAPIILRSLSIYTPREKFTAGEARAHVRQRFHPMRDGSGDSASTVAFPSAREEIQSS